MSSGKRSEMLQTLKKKTSLLLGKWNVFIITFLAINFNSFEFKCCNAFELPKIPLQPHRQLHNQCWRQVGKSTQPKTGLQMIELSDATSAFADSLSLPFADYGKQLFQEMNIGEALSDDVGNVPESATIMVLDSIGRDLLVFLSASVVVSTFATAVGITPILGYLIAGALLGPHGANVFSNTKAAVEFGDFGILFLLFSEGLEVSSSRLQKLANYLPLGFAQIALTAGVLSAGILGIPGFLERFLPLDAGLINVKSASETVILSFAGALSTSAFIFPVLKEKEWEEEDVGQAATSILLLQDLLVAPLLVIIPFVVGTGPIDYAAIGFLSLKALVGFGSVIAAGSYLLRRLFSIVATTRSTETFVSLSLLVSVGMGAIAKSLGLTDTAGAFAAGVLLANTNYRAQIQADITPFKGILLGIFFMDAGSSFDLDLVLRELPTVITGVLAFLTLKGATLFAATNVPRRVEPNRLNPVDGIRLSILLSGGGEFAFVVLALAERVGVLPKDLGGLLTAIVLITMAITPFLGEIADIASKKFVEQMEIKDNDFIETSFSEETTISSDAIVVCGYGEIGQTLVRILATDYVNTPNQDHEAGQIRNTKQIVAFDNDSIDNNLKSLPTSSAIIMYGDGGNPGVLVSSGITRPSAIFVSYENYSRSLSATARLRTSFPDVKIYARSQTRAEAQSLKSAGASEVVVESDELPRSAVALLKGSKVQLLPPFLDIAEEMRLAVAATANISLREVDELLGFFECVKKNGDGLLTSEALIESINKSNSGMISDESMTEMESWVKAELKSPVDGLEFCRLYSNAPDNVKLAIGDTCMLF